MKFDRELPTKTGYVTAIQMEPRAKDHDEAESLNNKVREGDKMATRISLKNKKINSNRAHKIFGHINADATQKTANYYDIQLQGKMDICEECLIGKARQKN